jgi:hypothetical protein
MLNAARRESDLELLRLGVGNNNSGLAVIGSAQIAEAISKRALHREMHKSQKS